jgi:hypothetical protein
MSWLRRQQDIASLFAVWALLFQVLLGPFAMAGHAFGATSLGGGIICTTRGLIAGPGTTLPKQTRHNDCPGCSHSCRIACGASPAMAAAPAITTPPPTLALVRDVRLYGVENLASADWRSDFQSRAPPLT